MKLNLANDAFDPVPIMPWFGVLIDKSKSLTQMLFNFKYAKKTLYKFSKKIDF